MPDVLLCAGILALGAALPASNRETDDPTRIAFDPDPVRAVHKYWRSVHKLESEAMFYTVGDERAELPGKLVFNTIEEATLRDEYRASADGRPMVLRRTFDDVRRGVRFALSGVGETAPEPFTMLQGSDLTGCSVLYTWVPSEQGYGSCYDARETDEEILATLGEDLDLRALLPAGPVTPGDAWRVEAAELRAVFAPLGRVAYRQLKDADRIVVRMLEAGIGSDLATVFEGESLGGAQVTFEEIREIEGTRIAALKVVYDFKLNRDLREYAMRARTPAEKKSAVTYVDAGLVLGFQGNGELLWNLEERRVHGYRAALAEHATQTLGHAIGGGQKTRRQTLRLVGTLEQSLQVRPTPVPPTPAAGLVIDPGPPEDGAGAGDGDGDGDGGPVTDRR